MEYIINILWTHIRVVREVVIFSGVSHYRSPPFWGQYSGHSAPTHFFLDIFLVYFIWIYHKHLLLNHPHIDNIYISIYIWRIYILDTYRFS